MCVCVCVCTGERERERNDAYKKHHLIRDHDTEWFGEQYSEKV